MSLSTLFLIINNKWCCFQGSQNSSIAMGSLNRSTRRIIHSLQDEVELNRYNRRRGRTQRVSVNRANRSNPVRFIQDIESQNHRVLRLGQQQLLLHNILSDGRRLNNNNNQSRNQENSNNHLHGTHTLQQLYQGIEQLRQATQNYQERLRIQQQQSQNNPNEQITTQERQQQLRQNMEELIRIDFLQLLFRGGIIGTNINGLDGERNNGLTQEQIDNLPMHSATKEDTENLNSCTICLVDFAEQDKIRTLPCIHHFHMHCIDAWLLIQKQCPNCRQEI